MVGEDSKVVLVDETTLGVVSLATDDEVANVAEVERAEVEIAEVEMAEVEIAEVEIAEVVAANVFEETTISPDKVVATVDEATELEDSVD